MKNAFSKSGILSEVGLTGKGVNMEQTAYLSVDEYGVNTSFDYPFKAGLPSDVKPEDFGCYTFDHPYAFVIKENCTGAILFIGVINKL